jgi:hypothetical protein
MGETISSHGQAYMRNQYFLVQKILEGGYHVEDLHIVISCFYYFVSAAFYWALVAFSDS